MKELAVLVFALACPMALRAQNFTLVSGTVTDPNGVAYYPAQVQACLTPVTTDPVVNGQHVNPNPGTPYCVSAQTSKAGVFQMSLPANASITPAGTQYLFTVTTPGSGPPAGTGPQNFTTSAVTISGSTQSVTGSFTGLPALLNSGSGGGTPCTSIASSVQYDNAGAFGCTPWVFTPADSSGVFCEASCASLTQQTSAYAGFGIFDPANTSVYQNAAFLGKGTSATGGSFLEVDSLVVSQGQGSGEFAQAGNFFSTISGNTGSSGSVGCVVETGGGPPCAAGLIGIGGDIETDSTSGQDLAGVVGGINMTKAAGKSIRFGAALIANSPECSGDAPTCASLFQPAETANSIFGLLIHDQGGVSTSEQAAIRIEPQTTPASGSKFSIDAAAGSGVASLADGLQTSGIKAALATKSAAYTLTAGDSWVNVTGNTTITVPHALVGQRWDVFNSGAGTVTLQCDSGTINGAASITFTANNGRSVTTDGTNCFAH